MTRLCTSSAASFIVFMTIVYRVQPPPMVGRLRHDGTRRVAAVTARGAAGLRAARVGPGQIDGPEDSALPARPAAPWQLDRQRPSLSQRTRESCTCFRADQCARVY